MAIEVTDGNIKVFKVHYLERERIGDEIFIKAKIKVIPLALKEKFNIHFKNKLNRVTTDEINDFLELNKF